ncbi:DUF4389 domain-containing protein [Nucisporomicrobium flavum]|uniref:DUF4389 domain-containing protein n=1 Tax=Nucisporomicrobium flavum TaxID=2785915 RepID=UPI0018F49FCD|nr:DUF4389 domain-containing protein [Nucisporomicrobium flavum]
MNRYPLRVEARRDEPLSRWLWLVKWLLLIPHILILVVLWVGFLVLTVVAYLAVLITGRYPHAIQAYNVGVLRWSWRVNYYGYQALGTDRYPPFTLADVPDHPARLHLDEPARPRRWLPLVAWLFAIPHLVILGALTGAATWTVGRGDTTANAPISVVAAAVLVAGFALLFTGRYPRGLYDLLVGIARWNLRVIAYLALLTPYPPFRLDQGEREPGDGPDDPPDGPPVHRAAQDGSVAGPVIALLAGVVLLVPAMGAGVAGGGLLAFESARDSSGYVTGPALQVSTATAAVTTEDITVENADEWTRLLADVGGIRITADSATGRPVFVGIGRRADVDRWLAGSARDRITDVTGATVRYERAGGAVRSVPAPSAQDFWLGSANGATGAQMAWRVTDGDFTVVLANADGSPGVSADVRGAVQVPDLTGLGAGLLIGGIVAGILAVLLIVVGGTGLGRRHAGPPPPPPPAGTPPQPAPRTPVAAST